VDISHAEEKGEWALGWKRSEEATSRPFEVEASRERGSQSYFLLDKMSPGIYKLYHCRETREKMLLGS
jgi:hypothetical protein